MDTRTLTLFLEEAMERLCDCDCRLEAYRIKRKYLGKRKSPYDRVPVYSRLSEIAPSATTPDQLRRSTAQMGATTPVQLRILREQARRRKEEMDQRREIERNMLRNRRFLEPVVLPSYKADLKYERGLVPIESVDVSFRLLKKQNEVKPPDFSQNTPGRVCRENYASILGTSPQARFMFSGVYNPPDFSQNTPGRVCRENYASSLGTSPQARFMFPGVDNPPVSLPASNDRDLVELCDQFNDVLSPESLSDREK